MDIILSPSVTCVSVVAEKLSIITFTVHHLCLRTQYASYMLYWVKHMKKAIQGIIVSVQAYCAV